MNYFEIMGLPVSFQLDEDLLRKTYYENSKKFHPDFHTLSSPEDQEEALNMSTLNNLAYKTLLDFDKRLKYILELTNTIEQEEKYDLSLDFLMEMMEINEEIMELQLDFDVNRYKKANDSFEAIDHEINELIDSCINLIPTPQKGDKKLMELKDLYYRKKYLLRIKDNLDKFAQRY